jgi:hypothetical protein
MPLENQTTLLDLAREAVFRSRDPRVSRLQRDLRLPYSDAIDLIGKLEQEGIVIRPFGNGEPILHADYQRKMLRVASNGTRLAFVRRLVATALFFFEMAEETSNGHSRFFNAIKPHPKIRLTAARDFFLNKHYCYGLGLTDAALAFNEWLAEQSLVPEYCNLIESAIRTECQPYERQFEHIQSDEIKLQRAYMRLARFYQLMYCEGGSFHSRVPDWTLAQDTPQSVASNGQSHPEHIVPCAVIGRTAMQLYTQDASVHDVARVIRKLLAIIWITQDEKDALDNGAGNWRDVMPPGWHFDQGCIYDRLHQKSVVFTPIESHPCTCV